MRLRQKEGRFTVGMDMAIERKVEQQGEFRTRVSKIYVHHRGKSAKWEIPGIL